MAIVKSPGGDLERYAVLSVVRIRFGLIPFEDQRPSMSAWYGTAV